MPSKLVGSGQSKTDVRVGWTGDEVERQAVTVVNQMIQSLTMAARIVFANVGALQSESGLETKQKKSGQGIQNIECCCIVHL